MISVCPACGVTDATSTLGELPSMLAAVTIGMRTSTPLEAAAVAIGSPLESDEKSFAPPSSSASSSSASRSSCSSKSRSVRKGRRNTRTAAAAASAAPTVGVRGLESAAFLRARRIAFRETCAEFGYESHGRTDAEVDAAIIRVNAWQPKSTSTGTDPPSEGCDEEDESEEFKRARRITFREACCDAGGKVRQDALNKTDAEVDAAITHVELYGPRPTQGVADRVARDSTDRVQQHKEVRRARAKLVRNLVAAGKTRDEIDTIVRDAHARVDARMVRQFGHK